MIEIRKLRKRDGSELLQYRYEVSPRGCGSDEEATWSGWSDVQTVSDVILVDDCVRYDGRVCTVFGLCRDYKRVGASALRADIVFVDGTKENVAVSALEKLGI
jgi:hypothetical protein